MTSTYTETATAFVEMAHRIVWCTVATVGPDGHPRTRILHPVWTWEADRLVGWIGTAPTPVKVRALEHEPNVSLTYWDQRHDTCSAECGASLHHDDETCTRVWELLETAPPPVGYDPAIIPGWTEPTADGFVALRLEPWRLRVFPGTVLLGQGGEVRHWRASPLPTARRG